jgi:hypothetical protein
MTRESPVPSLYASIRESYPGEIAELNEVLWKQFEDQKATHGRLSYAEYIFDHRDLLQNNQGLECFDFLLWRGVLFKSDRRLHDKATDSDRRLVLEMLRMATAEISETCDPSAITMPWDECPEGAVLADEDPVETERKNRAAFSQALAGVPTVAGLATTRPDPETSSFFEREDRPFRVDTVDLDAGVALLVKGLQLVGVGTWSSCDGHHLLGARAKESVAPASIDLAGLWDALWLEGLLKVANRTIDLRCDWQLCGSGTSGYRLTVAAPKDMVGPFERAFAQDSDLQNLSRWFLRNEINAQLRAIKLRCCGVNASDRIHGFHTGLIELERANFIDNQQQGEDRWNG